jgi:hypothetical protein
MSKGRLLSQGAHWKEAVARSDGGALLQIA